MNIHGIELKIVWLDRDMMELSLSVTNGSFAGQSTFYAPLDALAVFAKRIDGFPSKTDEVREYDFGGTTLPGYGGVKIRFFCTDSSGHAAAEVSIYSMPPRSNDVAQKATVQLNILPSAIDSFVAQLRSIQGHVGKAALLQERD